MHALDYQASLCANPFWSYACVRAVGFGFQSEATLPRIHKRFICDAHLQDSLVCGTHVRGLAEIEGKMLKLELSI